MNLTIYQLLGVVAVGLLLGYLLRLLLSLRWKQSAEKQAEKHLRQAREEADRTKKEAQLAAREELFRRREQLDKEAEEQRQELRKLERRLSKREDNLDRKVDILAKKEHYLEEVQGKLTRREEDLSHQQQKLEELIEKEKSLLHQISGISREQAKKMLLERLSDELEHESAEYINRAVEQTKETAEQQARNILSAAIQRCATNHTVESVVSSVDIPSDDMKGRIIGREGRNIRAFEKATGVDVIVDDTPGVVLLSAFDSVRREVARRALEKLILDGRIHPARIEEVVKDTAQEVDQVIREVGKQTVLEVGLRGVHPRLANLLGRLRFRTSFGQNVLQHSIEVAHLSGMIAAELDLDARLAKRCGLFHDIGKATDHEMEGGHAVVGGDMAKRYGEPPEVVNAAAAHHGEEKASYIYTALVAAGDAVSAGRPGARRETLERYIQRLTRLEEIAGGFEGVDKSYAIQAGREVRVLVNADRIPDREINKLCRDIAKQIEQELSYPGEVRVTVIRETRAVEFAR